jgi:hypothetical protein
MYNLPKFERTFVRTLNGETFLFTKRNDEDFWISRYPGTISHVTAFAKHTATVRPSAAFNGSGNLAANISSEKDSSLRSKSNSDVRVDYRRCGVVDLGEI